MIKLFTLWTRRPDQTHEEAVRYWLDVHAPLLVETYRPQLLRYACNIGLPANYQNWAHDEAPAWDGIGEAWYDLDDPAELTRLITQPPAHLHASEREFTGTRQHLLTDQMVHLDRARAHQGIKMFFLLNRRRDATVDQAVDYWRTRHAPLVRDTLGPSLVRYATHAALTANLRGWAADEAPPYDGIAVLAVDHGAAEQEAFVAGHADVLLPDERAFMGTYRCVFTTEVLALGQPDDSLATPPTDDTTSPRRDQQSRPTSKAITKAPKLPLAGRVAIVTGSSRGIGRALALRLAREGADVVVAAKSETAGDQLPGTIHTVADEIRALGRRALPIRVDVREEHDIAQMIQQTDAAFGHLDILINNAGALWWERLLDTPPKRYELMWQINLRASYLTAYYALPLMMRGGWGHLLSCSPAIGTSPTPGYVTYMTTKMGMSRLAIGIAAEHRDDNIASNALWPAAPIESHATLNWGTAKMGTPAQWRTADIFCDAAMQILQSPPATFTGRQVTDEEVLLERGWSAADLDQYWLEGEPPSHPLWIDQRWTIGNPTDTSPRPQRNEDHQS